MIAFRSCYVRISYSLRIATNTCEIEHRHVLFQKRHIWLDPQQRLFVVSRLWPLDDGLGSKCTSRTLCARSPSTPSRDTIGRQARKSHRIRGRCHPSRPKRMRGPRMSTPPSPCRSLPRHRPRGSPRWCSGTNGGCPWRGLRLLLPAQRCRPRTQ